MVKKDYKEDRKFVSRLIFLVLTESMSVREAILKFPKDSSDESLRAAYHALIHLEADEWLRHSDLEYKEEQDDYLEFLAQTLQEGNSLPKNIIRSYDKYYQNVDTPNSETTEGLLRRLCKFLNV